MIRILRGASPCAAPAADADAHGRETRSGAFVPRLRDAVIVVALMVVTAGLSVGTAAAAPALSCQERLDSINTWTRIADYGIPGVSEAASGVAGRLSEEYVDACALWPEGSV